MIIADLRKQNILLAGINANAQKDNQESGQKVNTAAAFKDLLGMAFDNKSVNTSSETGVVWKTQNQVKTANQEDSYDREPFKNFRQIQKSICQDAKKSTVQNVNVKEAKTGDGNDGEQEVKETPQTGKQDFNEAVVESFASLLGLKPEEFKAVLDKAGVTEEQLTSLKDMNGISGKISEAAGLDSKQSEVLSKLMNLAAEKISRVVDGTKETSVEAARPDISKLKLDFKVKTEEGREKVKIFAKELTVSNNSQQAFQAALVKLRLNMGEWKEKSGPELSGAIESMADQLQKLADSLKTGAKAVEPAQTTQNAGVQLADDSKAAGPGLNPSENKTAVSVDSGTESKTPAVQAAAAEVKPAANAPATADSSMLVNPMNVQAQQGDTAVVKDKSSVKLPVQAKEVINQVIEKAKVVISADKSEMVMDLKPDSLGKISLKVVTEQGIVMAKFVAENEQVKQIIETNLQLLKDSLEKQGMNVQGFSVSVGQERNPSSNRQLYGENSGRTVSAKAASSKGVSGIAVSAEAIARTSGNNPYNWGTSTINFTA